MTHVYIYTMYVNISTCVCAPRKLSEGYSCDCAQQQQRGCQQQQRGCCTCVHVCVCAYTCMYMNMYVDVNVDVDEM